ncbi:hypothetical protein LC048_15935 [Mesobacillus subterraneus]|uniref:hypothetical protein n=1 Tax=Mesobacillus subterraneus TaxID=285983 RepID=UPI001CFE8D95|nr:hypothetical protein [Mesobacillus subterraneus]WLR53977.1 hypothetical protein LC048_15935 [Mesobacillus subterraneus]
MTSPERTEATRGARRWSWTIRKAEATAQLRQALEGLTVKSLFDFIGRTETSRGVRSRSWTTEKRKRLGQPRQALEGRPVKSFFDFT